MPSTRTTLAISGMHCASCAAIITRKLKKTPGVADANVNYGTAKASVTFDADTLKEADLIAAVKAAGYDAAPGETMDRDAEKKRRQAEMETYRGKFWIGFVLSFPMLGFMVLTFLPHSAFHD